MVGNVKDHKVVKLENEIGFFFVSLLMGRRKEQGSY